MSVVPESPVWLRRRGKVAEAETAETALWGAPDAAAEATAGDDKGEKDASVAELPRPPTGNKSPSARRSSSCSR